MATIHQSTGNPRAPENSRLYAVGDIHGRLDLLHRLHRQILDDAKDAQGKRKVIIYVGDYVDRGPDSFGVIDWLINKPLEGFEHHFLRGNHEDMMTGFLETGSGGESWLMNGGRNTMDSYGIGLWDMILDFGDLENVRQGLKEALPESHLKFMQGLELHHREGDYLFVHAGIRPGRPLEEQSEHDLLWIRGEFLDSGTDHGFVVVHGHSSRAEPDAHANRIGIDTGAWRSGRLTALVLETASRRFLQT